jgi:translation initiation factor 3 subunit M
LLTYVARSRPEEERAAFIAPLQESVKNVETDEQKKAALQVVLNQVNGLGDGSEKGAHLRSLAVEHNADLNAEVEGFFNLLYAHLFSLYPSSSSDAKEVLNGLLTSISATPADRLPIAYRVCVSIQYFQ